MQEKQTHWTINNFPGYFTAYHRESEYYSKASHCQEVFNTFFYNVLWSIYFIYSSLIYLGFNFILFGAFSVASQKGRAGIPRMWATFCCSFVFTRHIKLQFYISLNKFSAAIKDSEAERNGSRLQTTLLGH